MIEILEALARPLLGTLDPEMAHRLTIKALACLPGARAAARRSAPRRFGLRPTLSQSARPCRGLRQTWRSRRCDAGAWLWLRRSRHGDAKTSARQSAPAPLSAERETKPSSTATASTARDMKVARRRLERRKARGGIVADQSRRQQRDAAIAPPIMSKASRPLRRSQASSSSMSLRPIRRACAICRKPKRSTI